MLGRPANHAPKNAAGIGRINRILTAMLLRPSTAPISTPEQASNTAIPAAADQHQQIAVKGAGAEQRFVAGQKFMRGAPSGRVSGIHFAMLKVTPAHRTSRKA